MLPSRCPSLEQRGGGAPAEGRLSTRGKRERCEQRQARAAVSLLEQRGEPRADDKVSRRDSFGYQAEGNGRVNKPNQTSTTRGRRKRLEQRKTRPATPPHSSRGARHRAEGIRPTSRIKPSLSRGNYIFIWEQLRFWVFVALFLAAWDRT